MRKWHVLNLAILFVFRVFVWFAHLFLEGGLVADSFFWRTSQSMTLGRPAPLPVVLVKGLLFLFPAPLAAGAERCDHADTYREWDSAWSDGGQGWGWLRDLSRRLSLPGACGVLTRLFLGFSSWFLPIFWPCLCNHPVTCETAAIICPVDFFTC